MPMQATDNYSDFVEERSAGVIVVLAEQRERRERRTALFTISRHRAVDEHACSGACAHSNTYTHTHTYTQI